MHPICAEYAFEKLITPSVEISVFTFDMQPICAEYGLETLLAPTEKIRVMDFDLDYL